MLQGTSTSEESEMLQRWHSRTCDALHNECIFAWQEHENALKQFNGVEDSRGCRVHLHGFCALFYAFSQLENVVG
jgi:hypothetical protein